MNTHDRFSTRTSGEGGAVVRAGAPNSTPRTHHCGMMPVFRDGPVRAPFHRRGHSHHYSAPQVASLGHITRHGALRGAGGRVRAAPGAPRCSDASLVGCLSLNLKEGCAKRRPRRRPEGAIRAITHPQRHAMVPSLPLSRGVWPDRAPLGRSRGLGGTSSHLEGQLG